MIKNAEKRKLKFYIKMSICFITLLAVFLLDNGTILGESHTVLATNEAEKPLCYLSDIPYVAQQSSVGWGRIMYDKNPEGGLITLLIGEDKKQTSFIKGIGAHANSTLVYDLSEYNYDIFRTYAGIDASKGSNGNGVKFYFYTSEDGNTWTKKSQISIAIKGDAKAIPVDFDIKGAKYLKLECNNNGNADSDHAVYANARLVKENYVEPEIEPATFIKTVKEYDELIKAHEGEKIEGEYELLLLQRDLVSSVGYDMLQLFTTFSTEHMETISWLFNDLENLRLYIIGGKPDISRTFDPTTQKGVNANENYMLSLKVLNELYHSCKDDFDIIEETKYGTVLGDLYKRMAIALSLTHSRTVGLWMQSNIPENQSNAVTRYEIYKKMHKEGNLRVTENIDIAEWFEKYTIEEMRLVFNNGIDDEEILWLNEYTQSFIDKKPNEVWNYLSPHPYMEYVNPNYNNPIFHDPNRKQYWDEKFGGIFSKYGVSYTIGTYKIQKVWMNLRNEFGTGAVCGGISKTGSNIRAVHGIPSSVISQPGHAAIIHYSKNAEGKGYWSLDNDVSGWAQSGRTEGLNYRMPLGWGNEEYIHFHQDWLGMATYVLLAQGALNDYDNYQLSREKYILGDVYRDDTQKQIDIYRNVVTTQPLNIDGWYGLIKAYRNDETKTEADYLALATEIMENLKYYPLPMYHLAREAKKNITLPEYDFSYTLALTRALTDGKNATNANTIQWQATRTEANHLLGINDTELARFSFDGEDAGKIVLANRFDGNGIRWEYSIDGKQNWIERNFTSNEEHKLQLTPQQISSITAENDIYVHIVGTPRVEENLYKIDILNSAGIPNTLYANDLENRLIAAPGVLQWKLNENDEWVYYRDQIPDLTGDKTVIVKIGATGRYLAMNDNEARSYNFTQDNQPDTRKYISVSHLALHSASSQATGQGHRAVNAIDANINTYWHSNWAGSDRTKEYVIKLDEAKYISALEFYPVAGGNGKIESLGISVSMDGENWTEVVSGTNWTYQNSNDISTKTVDFDPTKALYVKLVGKKTQAASASLSFIAAKMFNLFEDTTIVADFSFDGENAGKIILEDIYSGRSWKYSVDGGNTWKDGNGDSYKLPNEDLNLINEENKIRIRFNGNEQVNFINIKKAETPSIGYLNDLENRVIGLNNVSTLEWKYSDGNIWTSYSEQEPIVKGDKTLEVRAKSYGKFLASDVIKYQFTKDTDTDNSKYIPIAHLTVEAFSSTTEGRGEPATNAIDGNINTIWHTNRVTVDKQRYIIIKLDEPRYITKLQYVRKAGYGYGTLKNGIISISMDGTNWEEAETITDLYNPTNVEELLAAENVKDIEFSTPKQAQYVKIQCTKSCDYVYGNDNNGEPRDYFLSVAMLNLFEDKTKRPTTGKLGDTDGDDNITTKDAKMVLQHIAGKITLTDEQIKRADASKDTEITTKDAKMILQHIAGKIDLSEM